MSATIPSVLLVFAELGELIFKGSETEGFVQPQRCLFLADQLTALAWALKDDFREGRSPEASALRALDTAAAAQAARLSALGEILDMAVSAAEDTLEAITARDFRRARQRVSEGLCLLWRVDGVLAGLVAPSESARPGNSSTDALFTSKKEDER